MDSGQNDARAALHFWVSCERSLYQALIPGIKGGKGVMGEWQGSHNGFSLAKAGYFEQGDNAFTVNDLAVIDHR